MKKLLFPALLLAGGTAAILLAGQLDRLASILLYGLGGLAWGLGGAAAARTVSDLRRTDEERRAAAIAETDERFAAIREKAALSAWHWTLWLLTGLFLVFMVMGCYLYAALLSLALLCHNLFYFVNIRLWSEKL